MGWADIAAAILRGFHLAALASLFGTLLCIATIQAEAWPRILRLAWSSALLAVVAGTAWFVLQAVEIAGAQTAGETLAALPVVALETQFGRVVLVRFATLLALLILLHRCGANRIAWAVAVILAGGALGLQPAIGHAGAMDSTAGHILFGAEVCHLLAAGAWLGALVPLLMCLATAPRDIAADTMRRFFPIGLISVSILAATSVVQTIELVGSLPALIGTSYGRVALLKLLLLFILVGFAAMNRLFFTHRPDSRLPKSIKGEAAFALAVMLAAGFLAHLTPGIHEQPVWPLPWRIDLTASKPSFVRAFPSSFFVSPTGFSARSIMHGSGLYRDNCVACHGAAGFGDGPVARLQPVAPADLTARRLLDYRDGDLFWFVGHAVALPADDLWDLVDYVRAQATGEFTRTSNQDVQHLRMPSFSVSCGDGRNFRTEDLRGQVLRLQIAADREADRFFPAAGPQPVTITLPASDTPAPTDQGCVAPQEARAAFAILLGTTPAALTNSELLVDANGWLRSQWKRGDRGGWPTPQRLAARVRALADHPLPPAAAGAHAHHH